MNLFILSLGVSQIVLNLSNLLFVYIYLLGGLNLQSLAQLIFCLSCLSSYILILLLKLVDFSDQFLDFLLQLNQPSFQLFILFSKPGEVLLSIEIFFSLRFVSVIEFSECSF